ncbi:UNVERIFIED_CONTAM: hypothetical protein PYX00_010238 [Menopon gallinae]|uniref:Uncharacterized protein n=1 Tax=Menopon gallinae TaxID=328185 RepID=A0AAW2HEU9_9NEOP
MVGGVMLCRHGLTSYCAVTDMKFTLAALVFLACRISLSVGKFTPETQNRFNRGVQTFDPTPHPNDSAAELTTLKPLPSTYTVVDWKRFYPFGERFRDANGTEAINTTATTEQSVKSTGPPENQLVYPVFIRVPIRVPLKAYPPKIIMPRTVRGAKSVIQYRYKLPPRYMMVKQIPSRRMFVAYYSKPQYKYKRHYKYVKPAYQKTGYHDLYKKSVYYPLRGTGYEVTEPKMEGAAYDPEAWKMVAAPVKDN